MENTHHFPPMVPHAKRIVGHYLEFKKDPLSFLERNAQIMGPVFRFKILHKEYVVAHHPEAIRHILVNQASKCLV